MDISSLLVLVAGIAVGFALASRGRGRQAERAASVAPPQAQVIPDATTDILEHMSVGVIVVDRKLRPTLANIVARELLGIGDGPLPGHLPSPRVTELARAARRAEETVQGRVEISYPARLTLDLQASPLSAQSQVLIVLMDISEEVRLQKVRREFVAHASHELKSPVASVQALTEALVQALYDDPDEAARFAQRLLSEAERMGKLVADLLDLSRLEEPDQSHHEPCDLGEIAEKEANHFEKEAAQRNISLTRSIESGLQLMGDAAQLRLLIRNLLDNAVQYTPDGGWVQIRCHRREGTVAVRVEDNGVGIPLQARSRIFERFYRVDRARSRARGGTGLGLAIVKHVAELHGGSIELESEVGKGSIFEISLPAAQSSERSQKESA